MDRLRHGYTNSTRRSTTGVAKRYIGTCSAHRYAIELACLESLTGHLAVPTLAAHDDGALTVEMSFVDGRHGQELIDEGHGRAMMQLLGEANAALRSLPIDSVPGLAGDGTVLVHGDFGPQNALFDLDSGRCVLIDWEFAHVGEPVEDLAWAEWIVRTHHPRHVDIVADLLAHAGSAIGWDERHAEMLDRCLVLLRMCESAGDRPGAATWGLRLEATEGWTS